MPTDVAINSDNLPPAAAILPARPALWLLVAFVAASILLRSSSAEPPATASPAPVTKAPSNPSKDEIAQSIKDLSSDAFSLRQEAAARLLAAGAAARPSLIELASGSDPETRTAARRLVALIDRSEFRRQLEAFAADADGRQGLSLPGWPEYQKLVGSDQQSRALFVDMQRQEGPLIAAMYGGSKRAPEELFESRLVRITQWQNPNGERGNMPPVGSCAAMLFLAASPDITVTDAAASFVQNIIQRPPINTALAPDNPQPALRKLIVTWLLQCPNKNEDLLRQRLQVISSNGLIDALPLALRVCNDPQYIHVTALTKALALLMVGQFGNRSNVTQLEPLLDDTSECLPQQIQIPGQGATAVQVRDVTLVMLLTLTDQNPTDYGYTAARLAGPRLYQLQTLYRETDQQRTESIAKWREWKSAHAAELKTDKAVAPPEATKK